MYVASGSITFEWNNKSKVNNKAYLITELTHNINTLRRGRNCEIWKIDDANYGYHLEGIDKDILMFEIYDKGKLVYSLNGLAEFKRVKDFKKFVHDTLFKHLKV